MESTKKLPNQWNPVEMGLERMVYNLPMQGTIDVGRERRNLGGNTPDNVVIWHIENIIKHYGRLNVCPRVSEALLVEWSKGQNLSFTGTFPSSNHSYICIEVEDQFDNTGRRVKIGFGTEVYSGSDTNQESV